MGGEISPNGEIPTTGDPLAIFQAPDGSCAPSVLSTIRDGRWTIKALRERRTIDEMQGGLSMVAKPIPTSAFGCYAAEKSNPREAQP
jgi:hypothetical protein